MAVSTGCYLLAVIGEPASEEHKQVILQRLNKGLLSWDIEATGCDLKGLEHVCASVTDKTALESDVLIQYSTESLGVEVLVNPPVSTLKQCVKNLLTSTIGHKHIIHAGYTFTGSGSWILQNGTYSFEDFLSAFRDAQVQSQRGCNIHVHCIEEGDWVSSNFEQEVFTKVATVSLNPPDKLDQLPGSKHLVDCLESVLSSQSLTEIMEASPLVGNIRFNRPTLYLFPAGQGDCALFGINGFNMLIDGGFNRKPCSWEFIRHLDRLDAVLVTRLSESNLCSMSTLMKRKTLNNTYPQIGYVFCNIAEGKNPSPGDEMQKDKNELLVSVVREGHEFIHTLNDLRLVPHQCWCDSTTEPFVLYHKVGHGTLEMHVLSPPKDSKEMKDFLSEWSSYKEKFSCVKTGLKSKGQGTSIPLSHATSVCAILVWRPNDPKDTITRILFPGSAPQNKIFEGLEKLKNLDILRQPTVTKASLSTILISKPKKLNGSINKAAIPNRKNTASPALSVSSIASRNGDITGLKKDIKDINKITKEVKKIPKDIKKDKVTKEIKKDNKDNKEIKKEIKKEVKDSRPSFEKKTATKPIAKKTEPAVKSSTEIKKTTTVKKSTTPTVKKESSTKTLGTTKPETKTKPVSNKTSESKTAKEVMNKKAAETKTAAKSKAKSTAAAAKTSQQKSKPTAVPKSPSKLSRAIAASAGVVATAAVTVGVAELLESKTEEKKEEVLNVEVEEAAIEKIEVKDLQNEIALEDHETNAEQNEIPVSPLRQEAMSPALSEPISLTASDTLSSAPIETVSPTPPPNEVISPVEEKDVNEIKQIELGSPPAERILDQEMDELASTPVHEAEEQDASVDEGIAENDIVEDENEEAQQMDNKIPEPEIPEHIKMPMTDNKDIMSSSFIGESLEPTAEEIVIKESAVLDEAHFDSNFKENESENKENESENKENESENKENEYVIKEKEYVNVENQNIDEIATDISDIDAQLAAATMEGSFCAGMTPAAHEEVVNKYNPMDEIEQETLEAETRENIMETSIVVEETEINRETTEFEAMENRDVEEFQEDKQSSENILDSLDVQDYHHELNPSLEVNVQDTHSEISTQGSDIRSEEIQQISNLEDNRFQTDMNIDDLSQNEIEVEDNIIHTEMQMGDTSSYIENQMDDNISYTEKQMDENISYTEKHMDENISFTERQIESSPTEMLAENIPQTDMQTGNIDLNDERKVEDDISATEVMDDVTFYPNLGTEDISHSEIELEEKVNAELKEESKENFIKENVIEHDFIEKDIDEKVATDDEDVKLEYGRPPENQPLDYTERDLDSTKLPPHSSNIDQDIHRYSETSSKEVDYPLPASFNDVPEDLIRSQEFHVEEEESEKVYDPVRKESSVSIVYDGQDEDDSRRVSVAESEDDVDLQHYMSKNVTETIDHDKLTTNIPGVEDNSDDDDVVKSPTPHAVIDYDGKSDNSNITCDNTKENEEDVIEDKNNELYSSEKKQNFDEKDHDSTEEEMIRHPTPPGGLDFYQHIGPNEEIDEMKDPIGPHFIPASAMMPKNQEEPLYEEPEDSASDRSQSPVVEQPIFSSIDKVDYPELVNVSGGTTPSEPQSPKSPLDSRKGNLGAIDIEVMEALSEHDCSEGSSQSPMVRDGPNPLESEEKDKDFQVTDSPKHHESESESDYPILEDPEHSTKTVIEEHKTDLTESELSHVQANLHSEQLEETESRLNLTSQSEELVPESVTRDISESDFSNQPESDLHYEQTSEFVCKPESEQHCDPQSDLQFNEEGRENASNQFYDEDSNRQKLTDDSEMINEQVEKTHLSEVNTENIYLEEAREDEYNNPFLPPSSFTNETEVSDLPEDIESTSVPNEFSKAQAEEPVREVESPEHYSSNVLKDHFENLVEESSHQKEISHDEYAMAVNETSSKTFPETYSESSQMQSSYHYDSSENYQNTETYSEQTQFVQENKYLEDAVSAQSKYNDEYDDPTKAIPESERDYLNGFNTSSNIVHEEIEYSVNTSDTQVPPIGINGQSTNSWKSYTKEISGIESSYNSNYNSSYSEMNTAKITTGEQQMSYVVDSHYQSDSPEDNSMKNSSSPDVPSPVDPEIVPDPLNPLSVEPPIGYDGINNKFIPTDDYSSDNMNYMSTIPPPLKDKYNRDTDRPYGESSEEEDSSSLPGNVSPYAYTNKAYNQEEEEDADGNHIIKQPLRVDQSLGDGMPTSTYDPNNPQNFPENLTFESHHQRVNSGIIYSPGFNQEINATDPSSYDFRLEEWGKPMGLPTPPETNTKTAKKTVKSTTAKSAVKNVEKRSSLESNGKSPATATKLTSSPLKKVKETNSGNSNPVYVDLAYIPHHGDPHYSDVEFFKKIRARYYVFSGISPSKEVLNALLEAKKGWNEDLETTIIPTYETDTLGYWMAQNQEALTEYSIDVAPSASRCTVNLQDHDTSCAAYRLEF